MTNEELKQEITRVFETEYGIELKVNDPVSFRRRFYALRVAMKSEGDNSLDEIMCRIMAKDVIHLVHKGKRDGERRLREGDAKAD